MKPKFRELLVLLALLLASATFAQEPKADAKTAKQQAPIQLPAGVTAHRDLAYVPDGHERQKLDLYLPEKGEKLPVIVWIHGGGWEAGGKERPPVIAFTAKGYATASINYRLSQHAVFPAQIEDCKAAIRWLRANASKYRLDPDRIGVWGLSAGGHLVALLGTSGGVKELDKGANLNFSSRVQAVCDWAGPSDFLSLVSAQVAQNPKGPVAKLFGGPLKEHEDLAKLASPVTHAGKDAPPFLIMHGEKDNLVPQRQAELLQESLKKAGADSTLVIVPGGGHVFFSQENNQKVVDFFDHVLLKNGAAAGK
ncbi:MAG: alpha/beta hydrolase [Verrucomicrobia bacterium]|nr:alpha/beta hydrolase [Verrucomicrobiota bacterium]